MPNTQSNLRQEIEQLTLAAKTVEDLQCLSDDDRRALERIQERIVELRQRMAGAN